MLASKAVLFFENPLRLQHLLATKNIIELADQKTNNENTLTADANLPATGVQNERGSSNPVALENSIEKEEENTAHLLLENAIIITKEITELAPIIDGNDTAENANVEAIADIDAGQQLKIDVNDVNDTAITNPGNMSTSNTKNMLSS